MRTKYRRKSKRKKLLGRLSVDRRIILKWILIIKILGSGLLLFGSGQGSVAGYCEHGNEPSGFI
jgi:hypothetical protein